MSVLACALLFLFALPSVLATVQIQFYTQSVPCSATNTPAATLTMRGDNSCESIVAPTGTPSAGQQFFARSFCTPSTTVIVLLKTFSDSSCTTSTGDFSFFTASCGTTSVPLFGALGGNQASCLAPLGTIPPVTTAPPVTLQCYAGGTFNSANVVTYVAGQICASATATNPATNGGKSFIASNCCGPYGGVQMTVAQCMMSGVPDVCFTSLAAGTTISNKQCCTTNLCNKSTSHSTRLLASSVAFFVVCIATVALINVS
jgi:hypothetical protein